MAWQLGPTEACPIPSLPCSSPPPYRSKVHLENVGGVQGATDKVRMTLTVRVEAIDFDPEGMQMRVRVRQGGGSRAAGHQGRGHSGT